MTVKELIEILEKLPPELPVLRTDNTGGYEPIHGAREHDATSTTGYGQRIKAVIVG